MELAFRLARRTPPRPAHALLVPAADVHDLLRVVVAVGGRWPDVFAVAGGFVVAPSAAVPAGVPGTIRLRRLAGDLFLPADADLLPALRTDEAADLTAGRGLVFLPGGTVLAFDPAAALPESAALTVGPVRRDDWNPIPEPPVEQVPRPLSPEVAAILDAGRPDGAAPLGDAVPDDARPAAGSPGATFAANAKLAAGRFLNWVGRTFGVRSLAEAGADLARRAVEQVPRLSEKVFGEQEAALRELLRQFQAGDTEKALRRAPIAVADPDGPPARVGGGSRLSETDPRYSLRSLLGGAGGGGAVAWLGGGDVWNQLAAEYRKLAEDAVRRGDFRRAAYLYGVLLRDPRQAAKVLDAGGLHHDAAVIYRDKLKDRAAAAACFERGECWDEAVALYAELEEFEKAGDIFRRLGDEARAGEMYDLAAGKLARCNRYLAAGDLIRGKAGNVARAEFYFRQGWANGGTDALGCGGRLVDDRIHAGEWDDLRAIVAQAEARFAPPRSDEAGRFFAHLTETADHAAPKPVADDLRDAARLALAGHLRETARTGRSATAAVSALFGNHGVWAGPVVRDAREALRREAAAKPRGADGRTFPTVKLVAGPVTAAVVARGTFDLVVAGAGGELAVFWAESGEVEPIPGKRHGSPAGLACTGNGRIVVVMSSASEGIFLSGYTRDSENWGGFANYPAGDKSYGMPYLSPVIDRHIHPDEQPVAVYHAGGEITHYIAPDMIRSASFHVPDDWIVPALSVPSYHWVAKRLQWRTDTRGPEIFTPIPWHPAVPPGSSFVFPPVDWLTPAPGALELAGVAADGAVYWTEAKLAGDRLSTATATATATAGYQAACLIRPGLVAAVTADNHVHWLRADGSPTLRRWGPPRTLADPNRAVFVAHRPGTNEVVVVFDDGTAVRVPKP